MSNPKAENILKHFHKHDPILYEVFLQYPDALEPIEKEKPENYFLSLCNDIVGQQLSGKAANAIFGKFCGVFLNETPTQNSILAKSVEELRATGLSNAKVRSVQDLAKHVSEGLLQLEMLDQLSDAKVTEQLVAVKGIGPWTAEMFLIFTLGREDVFSFGDLGLRKGMMRVYGFEKLPEKPEMEMYVAKWSPYKSFASRVLWKSLDNGNIF